MQELKEGETITVEPDEEDLMVANYLIPPSFGHFSGVYGIMNIFGNGSKWYVGSSKDILLRARDHRKNLRSGKHTNRHLQSSWNKHGEICFGFFIIEICELKNILIREQYWIDRLTPKYNMRMIVYPSSAGKLKGPMSQEHKDRISQTLKGRLFSAEHRENLSLSGKKRKSYKIPERTEKHRQALSEANKGKCVGIAVFQKLKTHCPKGHEYTKENTYLQISRGRQGRVCKMCKLVRDKNRYDRKKIK